MRFELSAPRQEEVELLGSWSSDPIAMWLCEDGVWRTPELSLPDGEHRYAFRLVSRSPHLEGLTISVPDPLARRLDAQEQASVVIVQGGEDCTTRYEWRNDEVELPDNDDLVLYRLDIDAHGGTFSALLRRLGYLQELGINALSLMPLCGQGPTRHFCAPSRRHGTPADLKRLVDECHRRGMRVILEMKLDGADSECSLVQIDCLRWFRPLNNGQYLFDHSACPARRFAQQVARCWKEEYHLDGFHIHDTRTLNSRELLAELGLLGDEDAPRSFVFIAQHLPEDPSIATAHGPADSAWFERFQGELVELLTSDTVHPRTFLSTLQPRNHGYEQPELVLKSLDERAARAIADSPREDWALQREKLAATLLFLGVGLPMLYGGQERGLRPSHAEALLAHHRRLIELRHRYEGIRGPELELLPLEEPLAVAFWRKFEDEGVLVVANLGPHPLSLPLVLPEGRWLERLHEPETEILGGDFLAALGAYEARVYVKGPHKLRESVSHSETATEEREQNVPSA